MNKRQAKKAFKKRYGCTPNLASKILEQLPEIMQKVVNYINRKLLENKED